MEINNNEKETETIVWSTRITRVLLVPVFFLLYAYLAGMSAMMFDSCGVNSCVSLSVGYFLGVALLVFSFIFGVLFNTFNPVKFEEMSDRHGWMVLLLPRFAPFLFLAILMLAFIL